MNLGAHMSIAGSVDLALSRARETGCNAVQIFVTSPNRWSFRKFSREEVKSFREKSRSFRKEFLVAHSSYLVNLASPDRYLFSRSMRSLIDQLKRTTRLGIEYFVIHPGSHRGQGVQMGIERIASALTEIISAIGKKAPMILLETTAGQGNSIGSRFEEISEIIARCRFPEKLGACFDTCHVFAAGYDIRTEKTFEDTLRRFDRTIGLSKLLVFHLNDSLKGLGERIDRHTHIGKGKIGPTCFKLLVNDERFKDRPMILETPKGPDNKYDLMNLKILRSLRKPRFRTGG